MQPSPISRRVGVHVVPFGACSDFTHVAALRIARPPCVDFVARLRPDRLPALNARQLSNLTINCSSGSFPHWYSAHLGHTGMLQLAAPPLRSLFQPNDRRVPIAHGRSDHSPAERRALRFLPHVRRALKGRRQRCSSPSGSSAWDSPPTGMFRPVLYADALSHPRRSTACCVTSAHAGSPEKNSRADGA